jgi:hypothetical protein
MKKGIQLTKSNGNSSRKCNGKNSPGKSNGLNLTERSKVQISHKKVK